MTDITWMLRLVLNALYLGLGITVVKRQHFSEQFL
ncbi:Uncharacterised protein [Streptococcus dysgalactiae subsp. equisimilis]|uniref:Uncharacterized protein n=1 Tax=Streptococcus dysgalactiae subsp. equisimilis TaxID=119602 RepID=A0AAE9R0K8_STREQ|nr:Uncharacterised protein [Streptococcus dysgalactiae subsp. equisimilis]VTT16928.1 Uncharacterised protein [Streptococcus dysgalactiae]VTT22875.1 Uncharacterised protein [Streptococcus dysgalactiae subsp. equisimilis]VUC99840.1 Uncharacterised protein [Streptococcus sp. NCTC 11567]